MIPYFFYGSGMYRKHPNHTYGRNRNNSANNWAFVIFISKQSLFKLPYFILFFLGEVVMSLELESAYESLLFRNELPVAWRLLAFRSEANLRDFLKDLDQRMKFFKVGFF